MPFIVLALLIAAFVLFVISSWRFYAGPAVPGGPGVPWLVAPGLACWVLAEILSRAPGALH